jgi:hypothetical protein
MIDGFGISFLLSSSHGRIRSGFEQIETSQMT